MSVLTDSTPDSGAPVGEYDLLTPVAYVAPRANLLPPEIAQRAALRKMQALLAAAVDRVRRHRRRGLCGDRPRQGSREGGPGAGAERAAVAVAAKGISCRGSGGSPAGARRQAGLTAAVSSEVLWSNQLDTLRRRLPDGVRISTLTVTPIERHRRPRAPRALRPFSFRPDPGAPARARPRLPLEALQAQRRTPITSPACRCGRRARQRPVASFLETLAAMPGWGNVYLTNTTASGPPPAQGQAKTLTYSVTANSPRPALSHRYTNGS